MESGVNVRICMNVLMLFREIGPPELFREYGLKQTEFDALPMAQIPVKGKTLIQPRFERH